MQALRVDAVADAFSHVPLDGEAGLGKLLTGDVHRVDRNDLIHIAVHEQDGRR